MPASTTPDGIAYPLSTDPVAPLNTHFEDLANSVQDALAGSGKPYRYIGQVRYTASGTFTKASYPSLRAIRVRCQGPGGGGGGATTTGGGQVAVGGGGGGGEYAESLIADIAGLTASVTVTVGTGGAAATAGANNGGNGSAASSFGGLVAGGAGQGGLGGAARTAPDYGSGGGAGGSGGSGDIVIPGAAGANFAQFAGRVAPQVGGGTFLAPTPQPSGASSGGFPGGVGGQYGAGGSGGANAQGQGTARAGGAGANGIVILDLYA